MSNPMQALHDLGLNPFAVTLLAESMLKSAYVQRLGTKPLTFEFPVRRDDCAGWAGVRLTIEAVPVAQAAAPAPQPVQAEVPREAPSGWRLVPEALTEEMHAAAVRTIVRCTGNADWPPRVYRAMLAAAPRPQSEKPS